MAFEIAFCDYCGLLLGCQLSIVGVRPLGKWVVLTEGQPRSRATFEDITILGVCNTITLRRA